MARVFSSLIQSDFGEHHGNFEAVVLEGNALVHWWRDNSNDQVVWARGGIVVPSPQAAGPGCILQSDFTSAGHGNLEVVVPVFSHPYKLDLHHYFRDNATLRWQFIQLVAENVAGPASMIKSDFIGASGHSNFELVVPVRDGDRVHLQHFYRDISAAGTPWHPGLIVAQDVAGPGCLIQSDYVGGDGHKNLEVIVPLRAGNRFDLWHLYRETTAASQTWKAIQCIAEGVDGPGSIIQSDLGTGDHGNFEVVVRIHGALVHFFRDNADEHLGWRRAKVITDIAGGYASLLRSDYGGRHKNFEVLVDESKQSLVSYFHENEDYDLPWLRLHQVLIGENAHVKKAAGTRKLCQLTGEYDREGWTGSCPLNPAAPLPVFAANQTETKFHIRGTDVGCSFEHRGRLYFLFGDTFRVDQGTDNLDAIAWSTDMAVHDGKIRLVFYPDPPDLPGVPLGTCNVPMEGFSWRDQMYVFFTADYHEPPIDGQYDLMGRCVLGRAIDDAHHFATLATLSRQKFVNVSVAEQTLDAEAAARVGLPVGTPVLWIWGTGRYRASGIYLAVAPLAGIETFSGIQYFDGSLWSRDENAAASLIFTGDAGELSVRWNPFLNRWILFFNSGNPRGILMHSAPRPWGPWTKDPVLVFDPDTGYGLFMHRDSSRLGGLPRDYNFDDIQGDCGTRDNQFGGEYGPYQIPRFATGEADKNTQIYFTMSTWNPYQVMLMTTQLGASLIEDTVNELYAILPNGDLMWFQHTVLRGGAAGGIQYSHQLTGPSRVGVAWQQYTKVLPGGYRCVYAVTAAGDLHWYQHAGHEFGFGNDPDWLGPVKVGFGWNQFDSLIAGGDGVLYGSRFSDSALVWTRQPGYDDGFPAWLSPASVRSDWGPAVGELVFSAGRGILYAVRSNGSLYWTRSAGYLAGAVDWQSWTEAGQGFGAYKQLFASADSIYAITNAGELLWFRHLGQSDGSNAWLGPMKIADGWDRFDTVFAQLPGNSRLGRQ